MSEREQLHILDKVKFYVGENDIRRGTLADIYLVKDERVAKIYGEDRLVWIVDADNVWKDDEA